MDHSSTQTQWNYCFFTGIHGVGKSTWCHEYLNSRDDIDSYTGGELIARNHNTHTPTNKKIKNVSSNQVAFQSELGKVLKLNNPFVLDGHLCLFNEQMEIEDVPEVIFEQFCPSAIVLKVCDTTLVNKRLKERDGNHFDTGKLLELQNRELFLARSIAKKFDIPFLEVEDNYEEFARFLDRIFRRVTQ